MYIGGGRKKPQIGFLIFFMWLLLCLHIQIILIFLLMTIIFEDKIQIRKKERKKMLL